MTHMIFCLCPDAIDGVWAQSGDRCESATADTRRLTHAQTRAHKHKRSQTRSNAHKHARTHAGPYGAYGYVCVTYDQIYGSRFYGVHVILLCYVCAPVWNEITVGELRVSVRITTRLGHSPDRDFITRGNPRRRG